MNIIIVVAACITVAAGSPKVKTWTLYDLSEAIQANETDSELKPHLVDALNTIMLAMFTGENEKSIHAVIRSPDGGLLWTQAELMEAIKDPSTTTAFRNSYRRAYQYLEFNKDQKTVEVSVPALDVSTWTLAELKSALGDRTTHPDLLPLLQQAKTDLEKDSDKRDKITIVTPVGLIKSDQPNLISRKW